jgi:hypothetical protein
MLRLLLLATVLALASCHREPTPTTPADGELPPLPPASGTPVGYLLDNASQLALTDEQIAKLRQIDSSLSVRNEGIDTQLREIEKPEAPEPRDPKGPPQPPPNMAPGAQPLRTTADASKLHAARAENNKEALAKVFALLDPSQQATARKLLDARGISSPDAPAQPGPPAAENAGVPGEP